MGLELEAFPAIASSDSSCPFETRPVSKGAASDPADFAAARADVGAQLRHCKFWVAPWMSLGSGFLLELLLEGGVLGACWVGSQGFWQLGGLPAGSLLRKKDFDF